MAENPMAKRWMITVWEDHAGLLWDYEPGADVVYAAWQKEHCPETGRNHWHVYVRYNTRKRFSTVTRTFPDGIHAEIARGSEETCRDYCNKEESRIEGPFQYQPENFTPDEGKQGRRSDLEDIKDKLKSGASLAELAELYPADLIRYHNGIKAMQQILAPKPPLMRDVTVIVLWGTTGTGKTHRMLTTYPEIYSVKPGRDPWGQYNGEKQILFDEFDYEKWPITDMNRYLDKWRCLLDARYSDRYAGWELVAICANSPPLSWYPTTGPMLLDAFRRRIRGRCWNVTDQGPTLDQILTTDPTAI